MDTYISGIPCSVRVTHFEPITPAYTRGHPDNWEPACGGELEFDVLDLRGRQAPWLEAKLDDTQTARIKGELLSQMATNDCHDD